MDLIIDQHLTNSCVEQRKNGLVIIIDKPTQTYGLRIIYFKSKKEYLKI